MSSDDILARLTDAHESLSDIGGAWERDVVRDAAAAIRQRDAEIERLQRWKAESITLLKQWNQIADDVIARLDADETLGLRLPDIVASELERLRDENAAFRAQFAFADEIREAFANWDGTDASLPEGWRRER